MVFQLAVDIDNTIADSGKTFIELIKKVTNGRVNYTHEYWKNWDFICPDENGETVTRDEWETVHNEFLEYDNIVNIEPMPGAIEELVQNPFYDNLSINIVTTRRRKAYKGTIDWLDKHGFKFNSLKFCESGKKHVNYDGINIAIEDDYEQAALYVHHLNIPCYLLDHPYNQVRHPLPNVIRVYDWKFITAGVKLHLEDYDQRLALSI